MIGYMQGQCQTASAEVDPDETNSVKRCQCALYQPAGVILPSITGCLWFEVFYCHLHYTYAEKKAFVNVCVDVFWIPFDWGPFVQCRQHLVPVVSRMVQLLNGSLTFQLEFRYQV